MKEEHALLDSHKLAAIAMLVVMEMSPLRELRDGVEREDNLYNEALALYLGHKIMLVVRKSLCENDSQREKNMEKLGMCFFLPLELFDELSPQRRYQLILAYLESIEDNLINHIRCLGFICFLVDTYHRAVYMEYDNDDRYDLSKPLDIPIPDRYKP
jgi:hypothetical protein